MKRPFPHFPQLDAMDCGADYKERAGKGEEQVK
jgi:hypothetical protein